MKKVLDYFGIDGGVGGNQEWFRNVVMYMGGCAAAVACDSCIYFALHGGREGLYPFRAGDLTKEEYIRFSMQMKPYIRPRKGGVKRLSMFTEGFGRYLRDRGETGILLLEFEGSHTWEEAARFIKGRIDAGFPVPYLLLKHKRPEYKDFTWHWFLCFGYEEKEEDLLILAATYGKAHTLSLRELWDTGYEEKGGLIGYDYR